MKTTTLVCSIVMGSALASFVGWRVHATRVQPIVNVGVVYDRSKSDIDGCDTRIGLAERSLMVDGLSKKSKLTVLTLGEPETANEPIRLATYSIPISTKVIEGRKANRRRQEELLKDLWAKCKQMKASNISPIFLAVKQSVADLRASGCSKDSHCFLYVDSDLEENVDPGVKDRLNGVRTKHPLPTILDNAGITVTFCGLAATTGRVVDSGGIRKVSPRDSARDDRLRSVWSSLFSNQDVVTFEPFCPMVTNLELYQTAQTTPPVTN